MVGVLGALSYTNLQNAIETNRLIHHAQEVIVEIATLSDSLVDSESNQRGYLLTGDKSFLEAYDHSLQTLSNSMSRIRELVANDSAQIGRLNALAPLLKGRLELLSDNFKFRTPTGLSITDSSRLLRGKRLMDGIDLSIDAMRESERQLLFAKTDAVANHERVLADLILGGTIASLPLIGSIFFLIDREVKRRRRAEDSLQDSNAQLESRVAVRTAQLHHRESQLRLFIEAAPAAIAMFDREMRYLVVSRRFVEDYHLKEVDLIGRSHYDVFPEISKRWRDIHLKCLAGAIERCDEDPFVRSDGQTDWIRWEIRPWYEGGVIGGVILFSEVITERKRAEEQRRVSEATTRAIVESTVDGIITITHEGAIQTFSGPAERIFGYKSDEVVGRNVSMLMPEPDRSGHDSYLQNYLRTGIAKIIGIGREVRGLRKNGSIFPMDLAVGELPSKDNRREFVGTVRDISARRQLEDQLRQAQKMEAVGQLTGGIAHDFNNLLGVVIGNLDVVLEHLDSKSENGKMIRRALDGALHGAELTHRLLAFARQQELEPKAFSINDLLSDIISILKRTLGDSIAVQVAVSKDLWPAFADPSQVQDAIMNLAINARDAMPHGGTLTIETANIQLDEEYTRKNPDAKPGDYAMLAVTDTGTGMPREVMERALEPFFTTKPVGQGTGLGLSMVYGFVRQSGGHLKIYSEVGHGTTVKLYLPWAKEGKASSGSAINEQQEPPRGSEAILVAEDNADLREVAIVQLSSLGYRVLEAKNGEAALAIIKGSDPIDLLFSDIVMSGKLTGHDLMREAKICRPDLEVLLTTGYAENATIADNDAKTHLLRKPYRRRDLALKVRAILDQRKGQ
jgi:PAS domain S-box-containing protein